MPHVAMKHTYIEQDNAGPFLTARDVRIHKVASYPLGPGWVMHCLLDGLGLPLSSTLPSLAEGKGWQVL